MKSRPLLLARLGLAFVLPAFAQTSASPGPSANEFHQLEQRASRREVEVRQFRPEAIAVFFFASCCALWPKTPAATPRFGSS